MSENENCSGCPQHHDCKSMYQAIGNAEGSFVVIRSIGAFLVPILIFSLGLAFFDKLLNSTITGSNGRTMISVILSMLICSIYVMTLRFISSRSSEECIKTYEGDEKSK